MEGCVLKTVFRIDWSELDAFGHVNSLAILKYVQTSRVSLLEAVGLMQSQTETGIGAILASISCQYRKPLFYPGRVTIHSGVDEIKNTSFRVCHELYNERDEIVAEVSDILVLFDFCTQAKLRIPDDLKQKIEQFKITCRTTDALVP